jgi:hypothetical protein
MPDVGDVLDDAGLHQAAALLHTAQVQRDLLHQRPGLLLGGRLLVLVHDAARRSRRLPCMPPTKSRFLPFATDQFVHSGEAQKMSVTGQSHTGALRMSPW